MSRALSVVAGLLLPAAAEACASCIGSPYGDQTYNWPYLMLILVPFAVATTICGVLAYVAGVRPATLARRLWAPAHPAAPQEETT